MENATLILAMGEMYGLLWLCYIVYTIVYFNHVYYTMWCAYTHAHTSERRKISTFGSNCHINYGYIFKFFSSYEYWTKSLKLLLVFYNSLFFLHKNINTLKKLVDLALDVCHSTNIDVLPSLQKCLHVPLTFAFSFPNLRLIVFLPCSPHFHHCTFISFLNVLIPNSWVSMFICGLRSSLAPLVQWFLTKCSLMLLH